jgi:two-component sensor histidine kinase
VAGDLGAVPADVATPLAVVLAELLQNAVEHAFSSGSRGPGRVEVDLAATAGRLSVRVVDDGRGLPAGFSIERTTSLGLSIVRSLVTSQLGGSIQMRSPASALPAGAGPGSGPGTEVALEVPLAGPPG